MARASLADPELPNKVLKGRGDEVIRCISCLQGCIGENGKGNGIRCLVNPLTGMEDEYDLTPTKKAKQVLVIGGGIAGCEAAISAALKGHKVTLIEKMTDWVDSGFPHRFRSEKRVYFVSVLAEKYAGENACTDPSEYNRRCRTDQTL